VISLADYQYFADRALAGMVNIVESLGDERVNRRPDLPGANSPFGILTHCLGVMEYWGGHLIAGRADHRDRAAEFRAQGTLADLVERTRRARDQLAEDVSGSVPTDPLRSTPEPKDAAKPIGRTQGGALIHILEELLQHRGHLEITRDLLLAAD
jgi:hypothetical protein